MKKISNIPAKKKEVKTPFTIRTTNEIKVLFRKKAKTLGYKQNEFFALVVKGL